MSELIFKIQKAKKHGRSPIEILISGKGKTHKAITENTDELLQTLDKLLKRNKIELDTLNEIKLEILNGAGLTSQRIVKSIIKALSLDL